MFQRIEDMHQPLSIIKSPILEANESIYGYAIEARTLDVTHDAIALNDIIEALSELGLQYIDTQRPLFIHVDFNDLSSESYLALPPNNIIFVLDNREFSKDEILHIEKLYKRRYLFALTIKDATGIHTEVMGYLSHLLFDSQHIPSQQCLSIKEKLAEFDLKYVVINVEAQEDVQGYLPLCDYVHGIFYTKELTHSNTTEIDELYQDTLDLLNILQTDATIDEIALKFSNYPEITLKLLQYLNSPAFNLQKAIKSIRHALMMIGKKALKKWLLLIAFSSASEGSVGMTPLFYSVEKRTVLLSKLAHLLPNGSKEIEEEASFVGILSLLDRLIETTKEDMFKLIKVDDNIKDAVIYHADTLGKLLALDLAIEQSDTQKTTLLLQELHIDPKDAQEAILESYFKNE